MLSPLKLFVWAQKLAMLHLTQALHCSTALHSAQGIGTACTAEKAVEEDECWLLSASGVDVTQKATPHGSVPII